MFNSSSASANESLTMCAICQSSHQRITEELASPECCDHRFCLSCLTRWSARVNTCPVCRLVYQLILVFDAKGVEVARTVKVEDRTRINLSLQDAVEDDNAAIAINDLVCDICGCGDAEACLLLCDGCERGMHTFCLQPPLDAVPPGTWYCAMCERARRTQRSRSSRRQQMEAVSQTASESEISQDELEGLLRDAGDPPTLRSNARTDRQRGTYQLRRSTARERLRQHEAARRVSLRSPSAALESLRRELRDRRRRSEQQLPQSLEPGHSGTENVRNEESDECERRSESSTTHPKEPEGIQDDALDCSFNVSTIDASFRAVTDSSCSSLNATVIAPISCTDGPTADDDATLLASPNEDASCVQHEALQSNEVKASCKDESESERSNSALNHAFYERGSCSDSVESSLSSEASTRLKCHNTISRTRKRSHLATLNSASDDSDSEPCCSKTLRSSRSTNSHAHAHSEAPAISKRKRTDENSRQVNASCCRLRSRKPTNVRHSATRKGNLRLK